MPATLNWEIIEQQDQPTPGSPHLGTWTRTYRVRISHGWLVRTTVFHREQMQVQSSPPDLESSMSTSLAFVPLGPAPWA